METIEGSLLAALRPGVSPAELLRAVRAKHPEASKKEIIHAAFVAVILIAEHEPERARMLQDFALKGRAGS